MSSPIIVYVMNILADIVARYEYRICVILPCYSGHYIYHGGSFYDTYPFWLCIWKILHRLFDSFQHLF